MQKKSLIQLPRNSRISEKIVEYCSKYGKERDLEKFMRLQSPTSSRSHSATTTSDEDECGLRRLFISSAVSSNLCPEMNIKSASPSNEALGEHLVPIRIEEENGDKARSAKSSNTNTKTPPKESEDTNSKETQTPDSIAKSHKRLEWDSLGDVGYKKSMSTSNISVLERSLLREFFQEKSSTSSQKMNTNASEGDLKTLQFEFLEEEYKYTTKKLSEPLKYNTPPLASSTFVDARAQSSRNTTGARPGTTSSKNTSTKGTSMSLQNKFEKCSQTSVQRSTVNSQEVQVNMSSATSSNIGSSATPSSFDYYSSRSSHHSTETTTTTSNDDVKRSHRKKHRQQEQEQQQLHPFVSGINEMLARRKALGEKSSHNQQHENVKEQLAEDDNNSIYLHQLHDTLKKAVIENKENSASSSTIIRSPQLDLGIQLLCSLIDAKSLTHKQKRKLVRDIVKRISQMDVDDSVDFVASATQVDPTTVNNAVASSAIPSTQISKKKNQRSSVSEDSLNMQELGRNLPNALHSRDSENLTKINDAEAAIGVSVYRKPSPPTTSAKALSKLSLENAANRKISTEAESKLPRINTNVNNNNVSKVAPSKNTTDESAGTGEKTQFKIQKKLAPIATVNQKESISTSSSSQEVITTLKVVNDNSTPSDGTHNQSAIMREWLNPMTLSEIEYEEKKREFTRNAAKREKIIKKAQNAKSDTERSVQLNWIETEIQRLESLRHLILKEEDSTTANTTDLEDTQSQSKQQRQAVLGTRTQKQAQAPVHPPRAHMAEKLYDTVFSSGKTSTSSVLSESAEKLVQEIEVIIEDSTEDIVNLDDNLKHSKQRKRETQTVYDKPKTLQRNYDGSIAQGNARFRTVRETITTNEEQVLNNKDNKMNIPPTPSLPVHPALQRSKIDTPSGDSNDSESVCSFVQHRKREFMEQYKKNKIIHYETLLQQQQQQQQLLLKQQREILHQLQRRPRIDKSTIADGVSTAAASGEQQTLSGHYSVPMERTYPLLHHHYNPQYMQQHHHPYHNHYIHNQHLPQKATTHPMFSSTSNYPPPPTPPPVEHTTSVGLTSTNSAPPFEQQNQNSSSSIFCISSEVSVPMGNSNDTSSTPTTTHQYDDVAAGTAGVGVQTSDSLQRSHPIFKQPPPQPPANHVSYHTCNPTMPYWCAPQFSSSGRSECVQVKPKGIAYVINFNSKLSNGDETSSDVRAPTIGTIDEQPQLTLQDHLQRAKPKFVAQSKERKAILNKMHVLRQEREREMRDIVDNTSVSSLDKKLKRLPPPPTKRIRIFPTKEMKAMTSKRCEKLPEVVEKQQRDHEERRRRSNRIIRDVFNRRLQKRVRNGKLSLNHSRTVI